MKENILTSWDFLLLFFYFIVFSFALRKFIFRKATIREKKLLLIFFFTKVVYISLQTYLVAYVWRMTDSMYIFEESKNMVGLAQKNFSNIDLIFKSALNYKEVLWSESGLSIQPGSDMERNFFLVRVASVIYPLAFGRYLLICFGFCVISTIGVFKLYQVMTKVYHSPKYKKAIAFCLLFIPTATFYTSPIYKETLVYAFMGFLAVNIYNIYTNKKKGINILLLLMVTLFILLVKPYTIYALSFALGMSVLIYYLAKLQNDHIFKKFLGFLIITGVMLFVLYLVNSYDDFILDFVDTSNFYQELYNAGEAGSSFEIGQIETSFAGLIKKAPLAFYTTYFRPHIWEAGNAFLLFNAIESFMVLALVIFTFIKRLRSINQFFKESILAKVILYYCILMGILIGLTTFNFGTIVRYKATAMPLFCMMWFLILLHSGPKKRKNAE